MTNVGYVPHPPHPLPAAPLHDRTSTRADATDATCPQRLTKAAIKRERQAFEAKDETAEVHKQNWPEVQVHTGDAVSSIVWTRLSMHRPNVAICSTPCVTFCGAGDQTGLNSNEGGLLLEAPA